MSPSNSYVFAVPLFVAAFIALSGCDSGPGASANLSYRQVGLCKGYETPTGSAKAVADEAFAIFKIESIDNTKPSKPFTFDPALLYVDQSSPAQKAGNVWNWNRRFTAMNPRFWKALNLQSPVRMIVPAGEKVVIDRFVSIPVGLNNPTGGPDAKKTALDFVYDTEDAHQGEKTVNIGIDFNKTNSSDATTWSVTEDCAALVR
jgi:hypothetical protein